MLKLAPLQTGFDVQFEQQLDASCHRRFQHVCVAYMALLLGSIGWVAFTTPPSLWIDANWLVWTRMLVLAGGVVLAGCFLLLSRQRRNQLDRPQMMSAITGLMVMLGCVMLGSRLLMRQWIPHVALWGVVDIIALHVVACFLLPWRTRECVLPMVPLVVLWAGAVLVPRSEWDMFDRAIAAIASPAILIPGALVTAYRFRRSQELFDRDMLGRRVKSIGGELVRARQVHDAMFPKPLDTGHVTFEFEYHPIQELGGDYVHLHCCRVTGRVFLTLLDVAGHGIAAALTVNRLFGELERIRAEDPGAEPADVMELLNRYIFLTMSPHNLYATGACIMLDPSTGDLKWVNAGHPPALVRHADGKVSDLRGTTIMLGANSYAEFVPNQQTMRLKPGDVIIAYTDGAFEARDREGKRFGVAGLREAAMFDPPPRNWAKFLAHAVHRHLHGQAEDDMLIATMRFNSLRFVQPEREADTEQLDDVAQPSPVRQ